MRDVSAATQFFVYFTHPDSLRNHPSREGICFFEASEKKIFQKGEMAILTFFIITYHKLFYLWQGKLYIPGQKLDSRSPNPPAGGGHVPREWHTLFFVRKWSNLAHIINTIISVNLC